MSRWSLDPEKFTKTDERLGKLEQKSPVPVHFNKPVPGKPGIYGSICGFSRPGLYSEYQNEVTCPSCLYRLKERNDLEAMTASELDEQVCDAKNAEASAINQEGREAQIEYLMS